MHGRFTALPVLFARRDCVIASSQDSLFIDIGDQNDSRSVKRDGIEL